LALLSDPHAQLCSEPHCLVEIGCRESCLDLLGQALQLFEFGGLRLSGRRQGTREQRGNGEPTDGFSGH